MGIVSAIEKNSTTYYPDANGCIDIGTSVLTSRKVNNKTLGSNISLSYSDLNPVAASSGHNHDGTYSPVSHDSDHPYVLKTSYSDNNSSYSGSLNNLKGSYTNERCWLCTTSATNGPISGVEMFVDVIVSGGSHTFTTQRAEILTGSYKGYVYYRYYNGSSWSTWYLISPSLKVTQETFYLSSQTWTKSAQGMYYTPAITPAAGFNELYSIDMCGWSALKATYITFLIGRDSNKNKFSFVSSTNSFYSTSASVILKFMGI